MKEKEFKKIEEVADWLFGDLLAETPLGKAWKDGRSFKWYPQKDITTYELALCMYLVPLLYPGEKWERHAEVYDLLPPEAQRHFLVTQS